MIIKTGKLSNIGGRKNNDDTVEIIASGTSVRAYVGDGLGSYAGGKQASQTAGDALLTYRGDMLVEEELVNACKQAQAAVYDLQRQTSGNMKTTIVFLNIEDGKARWMHVGDSRLYHFVNGKLVHQTTDHSVSQMAVMMGEITTHQIRFHEDRNRVLRSLGGENAKADVSALLDVSSGNHAFLMCSDGFWEYVYEDEMEKTLQQASDPQAWIDSMEAILKQRIPSNNDNYTAGTVFVYSQPMAVGYAPKASSSPKSGKKAGLILFSGLAAVAVAAGVFLMKPLFSGEDEVPEQTIVLETETVVETTTVATTEETTEPEEQGDTQKSDGNSYDNNFDENNGDEASGDSETPSSAPSEPVPPDAIPSDSAPQDDLTPPVV